MPTQSMKALLSHGVGHQIQPKANNLEYVGSFEFVDVGVLLTLVDVNDVVCVDVGVVVVVVVGVMVFCCLWSKCGGDTKRLRKDFMKKKRTPKQEPSNWRSKATFKTY